MSVYLKDLRNMPYRERIAKASPEQREAHPELFVAPLICCSCGVYGDEMHEFNCAVVTEGLTFDLPY